MTANILSGHDFSKEWLEKIFLFCKRYETGSISGKAFRLHTYENVLIANLFDEPSTRTRVGFEIAAQQIGAKVINLKALETSMVKGESLEDTLWTLYSMGVDIAVIRQREAGLMNPIAPRIGVINAGDGTNEHPTQALIDAYTLWLHWKEDLSGKKISIVGDVAHSRVANSDRIVLSTLGADVSIYDRSFSEKVDQVFADADAIIVLRDQVERHGLLHHWPTMVKSEYLGDKTFVLHPGPVIRDKEIAAEVLESPKSLVREQVKNGVPLKRTLFRALLGEEIR